MDVTETNFPDCLSELGVGSNVLSADEIESLDTAGFLVLENILSQTEVETLRNQLDALLKLERFSAANVNQTPFQMRVNRPDAGVLMWLAAKPYNAVFCAVRLLAAAVFRVRSQLKDRLTSNGRPPSVKGRFLKGIRAELREMIRAEASQEMRGCIRLCDLVNKGKMFDAMYTHPKVLAAVNHVIEQPFKLSSLNLRAPKPGYGNQRLHRDWEPQVDQREYNACNTLWVLDDFTEKNGPTRIVAGSHTSKFDPTDVMENERDSHSKEEFVIAKAGSVIVVNSRTWHGGTINNSDDVRRIIQAYFVQRDQPPQLIQREYIREETKDRLSTAAQTILDVR